MLSEWVGNHRGEYMHVRCGVSHCYYTMAVLLIDLMASLGRGQGAMLFEARQQSLSSKMGYHQHLRPIRTVKGGKLKVQHRSACAWFWWIHGAAHAQVAFAPIRLDPIKRDGAPIAQCPSLGLVLCSLRMQGRCGTLYEPLQ